MALALRTVYNAAYIHRIIDNYTEWNRDTHTYTHRKRFEWHRLSGQHGVDFLFYSHSQTMRLLRFTIDAKHWNMIQNIDILTTCHDDVVCCNKTLCLLLPIIQSLCSSKIIQMFMRTATRIVSYQKIDFIYIYSPHWNNNIFYLTKKQTALIRFKFLICEFTSVISNDRCMFSFFLIFSNQNLFKSLLTIYHERIYQLVI